MMHYRLRLDAAVMGVATMTLRATLDYCGFGACGGRYGGFLGAVILFFAVGAHAQSIHPLTGVMQGHQVGGVAVDAVGNLYVADFGDIVWKIPPEGQPEVFARGFYGSSGNAIDHQGNLFQSSYYGDFITKIDRTGHTTLFTSSGLKGPVGIAIDPTTGDLYVANCNGNTIARVGGDGVAAPFAQGDLLKCPNGLVFDAAGTLYVVNYRDNHMLKIDRHGTVALFATVSAHGLGHVCFKKDRFYVTAFAAHEIYEVKLNGAVTRVLGNGQRGVVNGSGDSVRLSYPNGIACDPWTPHLYINEFDNDSDEGSPRRAIVRQIDLKP
jgi:DNA-binding beta-propeller fold protein YncE